MIRKADIRQDNRANSKKSTNECYYYSHNVCSCSYSDNLDKKCMGTDGCKEYISESQYFMDIMNGKEIEKGIQKQKEAKAPNLNNLRLEKSKKALKKEARLEAEKNQASSGFRLGDDPRFKDIF